MRLWVTAFVVPFVWSRDRNDLVGVVSGFVSRSISGVAVNEWDGCQSTTPQVYVAPDTRLSVERVNYELVRKDEMRLNTWAVPTSPALTHRPSQEAVCHYQRRATVALPITPYPLRLTVRQTSQSQPVWQRACRAGAAKSAGR